MTNKSVWDNQDQPKTTLSNTPATPSALLPEFKKEDEMKLRYGGIRERVGLEHRIIPNNYS